MSILSNSRLSKIALCLAVVLCMGPCSFASAADNVRIVVRGFIPNQHPGLETTLVQVPGSPGRTMIKMDLPLFPTSCFATDDRMFSSNPAASARMTGDFTLVGSASPRIEPAAAASRYRAGVTTKFNCGTGVVEKTATASTSSCYVGTPSHADNLVQVVITCKASDPLVPIIPEKFSPDMFFQGTFTYSLQNKTLAFKGDIGAFPSFEAYAQLDGGSWKTIMTKAPKPGAGPLSLIDLWQHINSQAVDAAPVKL